MHIESTGSGSPLLLIHGWGMHGGVWHEAAQRLSAEFRVHVVDLPGYGYSNAEQVAGGKEELDSLIDALSSSFADPLAVCGWSLGGQVALRWAARQPEQVRRLILVASTPCFRERPDWAFGMDSQVLEKFAGDLELNHEATLRRFIALQMRGSENERELLVRLRASLFSRGEPNMAALRAGLSILRDADQRGELPGIKQAALVIAGERDKLTPREASYYMGRAMPSARVVEVEGAAHAPFLSHPEIFVEHLKSFLHE